MNDFIKVHFPDGADEFKKGIIMMDEAVCFFDHSDHEHAHTMHLLIAAIVREFGGCQDEEE